MKTILVVDDEPDIRKTVAALLRNQGFVVKTAVNGDDCIKKLQNMTPDLIILDIMMPGTPVKDIVKKVKNIKTIFLTVVRMADAEKEELMGQGNVVDFIQKPFEINELVKRIKMHAT
ncbi:response regulator transcription factor [Candidatus Woesearchaeota archaeon]|nr:response regulator transcription factor [Candidatus Woesearchaeota archaeon]